MIPKILHYVWVGGPLPEKQRRYIDTWRVTNPEFSIVCWNEQNIDMSQPIIRKAYSEKKWAKVADIARLQAIQQMGGIYLDTDFTILKSLLPLLSHQCFFAFQSEDQGTDWVCNGVFGAEHNHWIINELLLRLYSMKRQRFVPERPTSFGPKLVTSLLLEHGLQRYAVNGVQVKDIYICPVDYFFPYSADETFREDMVRPQTIGIHHWEKSWNKSVPWFIRAAKHVVRTSQKALSR